MPNKEETLKVYRLKGSLQKRRGGAFDGGRVDTPMHTMNSFPLMNT